MRSITTLALPLLLAASCMAGEGPAASTGTAAPPEAPPAPEPSTVPVVVVLKGADLEHPRGEAVIRNAQEWKILWNDLHRDVVPLPPAPAVDFEKDLVVAVFAGEKPTAGYKIEVVSAERAGKGLVLTIREKGPPAGAITAQVLTHPYAIVRVPRVEGEIRFERKAPE